MSNATTENPIDALKQLEQVIENEADLTKSFTGQTNYCARIIIIYSTLGEYFMPLTHEWRK